MLDVVASASILLHYSRLTLVSRFSRGAVYYDDIAGSSENPFPGQIFNKPTAAGTPGVDVYSGSC